MTTRLPRSQRRAQLLTAARDVFSKRGYHAAAMAEIASRAGVSKPVLYQHFPSKLELYLALVDTATDELLAHLHEALSETDDNKQRVVASLNAYFAFVDDEAGHYRLLFETDLGNVPEVKARLDQLSVACTKEIAEIIRDDTGLPAEDANLLATGLVGLAQVTARYWRSSPHALTREAAAELVATLGWRGIRGFPKRDP